MSSFAGMDLFGSGPHSFRAGPWQRAAYRRGLPGLDGELLLDLGLRSRAIHQAGRLQASSAAALSALMAAIEARCDGNEATLIDNHGQSLARVVLMRFEPTTPVQRGRGFFCDYQIEYRQRP